MASGRRLLFDLNVVLDVLFDRTPHVTEAAALWRASKEARIVGLLPAHGFTTIDYLVRHEKGAAFARQTIVDLLSVFHVAAVDDTVIRRAATFNWTDFEDAVVAAAAEAASCEAIVTRNPSHFPKSPVPVFAPKAAIALIEADPKR
jgi:predicted nucleic acid-binding protein